ncbi:uncharacterized protein LOC100278178 [Zea mays]|uniref:Uncharacterized protein n=1 Tax=Zea mays TaxID=4577 RepID=B6U4Z7_MAIZE|nr:uncharacterized protein LOC100278178 [Zea mays]ACG44430.1 hypothetical protein [Zea mays]|eukprot:NP_001145010.1 uncharacterized protein LOC100278178 [Zea mays]
MALHRPTGIIPSPCGVMRGCLEGRIPRRGENLAVGPLYNVANSALFAINSNCNLADGEYVLVPEQGAAQEVAPDPAPESASEDLPATALEGSLEDMVAGVTWPSILPPGWTVEWDPTSAEEEHEE